eukprot:GEMP01007104.1.p1 GENE.GEMP01007104.1~~GEMP01007104.1.p1  ORF type:complete len:971 (+),score=253.04 GEMP01007104.1:112-3024(+)
MPHEHSLDAPQVSEHDAAPRWEQLRGAEFGELEPSLLVIRYNDPEAPEREITEDVFYDPQICRKNGQTRLLVTCEQVLQLNESAKSLRRKLEFCRENLKKCRKDYAREIQLLREPHAAGSPENERSFGSPAACDDARDFNSILRNLLKKNSAAVLIHTIMHLDPTAKGPRTNAFTEEEKRNVVDAIDSSPKKAVKLQRRIVELERQLEERSTAPKTAFSVCIPESDTSAMKDTKAQTDIGTREEEIHVCSEQAESTMRQFASKPTAEVSKLATAVHAISECSIRSNSPVRTSHEHASTPPTTRLMSPACTPSVCSRLPSFAEAKEVEKSVAEMTVASDTVGAANAVSIAGSAHTASAVDAVDVLEATQAANAANAEAENAELWARIRDLQEQVKQLKKGRARPRKTESGRHSGSADHIAYVHADNALEEKDSFQEDSDDSHAEEEANPWRTSLLTYRQRLEMAISQSGGNLSRSDFLYKDQHMRERRSRVMGHQAKIKQEAELLQSLKVYPNKGKESEYYDNIAAQPLFGCPAPSRVQNDRKVNQALLQSSYKVLELERQSNRLKEELAIMEDLTDTTTQQHKWLLDREVCVLDTTMLLMHPEIAEAIARYKSRLLHIHVLLDASTNNACTSSFADATEMTLATNELDAMGDFIEAALQRDASKEGARALDDFKQSRSGRILLQEQHANLVPKLHGLRAQAETVKLQKDILITRKKELEHEMARVALYMTRHISIATASTAASTGTISRQSRRFNTHNSTFNTNIPSPRSRGSLRTSTGDRMTDAMSRQSTAGAPAQLGRNFRVEWLEVPAETTVERGCGGMSKGKRRAMRWTTHTPQCDPHDQVGELLFDVQGSGKPARKVKRKFNPGSPKLDFGFRPNGEGEDSLENCALFKVTKVNVASILAHKRTTFGESVREKRLSRRLSHLNVPESKHFGTYVKHTMSDDCIARGAHASAYAALDLRRERLHTG